MKEGKSILRRLAIKAAYAVLTDGAASRETAHISEEGREAIARAIGERFMGLLNAWRKEARHE